MPRLKLILTPFMVPILMGIGACSHLAPVQVAQIPLRPELRQCEALAPMPLEALPAVAEDPVVRAAVIQERAAWMRRDLAQVDVVKDMCAKLGEVVTLVDANNAGPSDGN